MPVSDFLVKKWESRLYNWWVWRNPRDEEWCIESGDAQISSIWRMDELGTTVDRSGYRESGKAVLTGEASDTDGLMQEVRAQDERIFRALVIWIENDGTRGAQARRLDTSANTYRDRVDSGIRALERLSRRENSGLK